MARDMVGGLLVGGHVPIMYMVHWRVSFLPLRLFGEVDSFCLKRFVKSVRDGKTPNRFAGRW